MTLQLLEDLLLAETYHWKEALEQLQLDVAIHLEDIRAHPEYNRTNWLKVNSATREAILEQALKGFFHSTSNV